MPLNRRGSSLRRSEVTGRLDGPNLCHDTRQSNLAVTGAARTTRFFRPQKVSTILVIVKLIQNAFFKAILPGFDRETGHPGRYASTR